MGIVQKSRQDLSTINSKYLQNDSIKKTGLLRETRLFSVSRTFLLRFFFGKAEQPFRIAGVQRIADKALNPVAIEAHFGGLIYA